LLACSREGFVPIYGVGPNHAGSAGPFRWLQPEAGLLVPGDAAVELDVTVPPQSEPKQLLRLEVRVEESEYPLLALAIPSGESAHLRIPLPARGASSTAVLLRLRLTPGLVLPGEPSGEFGESRVVAAQLTGLCAATVTPDQVADALARFLGAERTQAAA
jgi:hypothetical protein